MKYSSSCKQKGDCFDKTQILVHFESIELVSMTYLWTANILSWFWTKVIWHLLARTAGLAKFCLWFNTVLEKASIFCLLIFNLI